MLATLWEAPEEKLRIVDVTAPREFMGEGRGEKKEKKTNSRSRARYQSFLGLQEVILIIRLHISSISIF